MDFRSPMPLEDKFRGNDNGSMDLEKALKEISHAQSPEELEEMRIKYLGRVYEKMNAVVSALGFYTWQKRTSAAHFRVALGMLHYIILTFRPVVYPCWTRQFRPHRKRLGKAGFPLVEERSTLTPAVSTKVETVRDAMARLGGAL